MPETLAGWLDYIERQHTRPIDLGLDRLLPVKAALGQRQNCPLITVAGTNGKGSTCAMLESILLAAGYRVGLYTSPHLLAYNERVRINAKAVSDAALCAGFARVEAARGSTPLTYFEFATLAAWEVFASQALDVVILEVGLGGRLDAVNIYDADCAIVTGVDIDHTDFLGHTREQIGFEKAGIFRAGKPAVCGDAAPPETLLRHAQDVGAELHCFGRDFGYAADQPQWQFWRRKESDRDILSGLPWPALRGQMQLVNASVVLAALALLAERLPLTRQALQRGLLTVTLRGRFQVLPGKPCVVLDVAHNAQAARVLAQNLGDMQAHARTWAVFGMLADKDIPAVIEAVKGHVDRWLPCSLQGPRGAAAAHLQAALLTAGMAVPATFPSPRAAFQYARENAGEDDRILVFGSFFTVAEVMQLLEPPDMNPHGG